MAEYCPSCFEKADFLHMCDEPKSVDAFGQEVLGEKFSLASIVIGAPLMGIVFDFFLPLTSSILISSLIALSSSAIVAFLWVAFNYKGQRSFRFFILNLKNFIYTPNMLKIFGSNSKKGATSYWFGFIALSTAVQILLITPANASFVENTIISKLKNEVKFTFDVKCPGSQIYFYQEPIECRVKTGILGITVPIRVTISPIIGTLKMKVPLS